jgi:hypothetical protein
VSSKEIPQGGDGSVLTSARWLPPSRRDTPFALTAEQDDALRASLKVGVAGALLHDNERTSKGAGGLQSAARPLCPPALLVSFRPRPAEPETTLIDPSPSRNRINRPQKRKSIVVPGEPTRVLAIVAVTGTS